MSVKELGTTILIVLGVLAAIGVATRVATKEPDNVVEEMVEGHIEDLLEHHFDLDDDSLDGVIDLSPWSPEAD